MIRYSLLIISMFFISAVQTGEKYEKPVLFIIGDSTVKNGSGNGGGGLWGWGDFMYEQLDTMKVSIRD
jgi:hypothetical protein